MVIHRQILAVFVTMLLACSESGGPLEPTTGGLAIIFTTTGSLPDADGYTFNIDGATDLAIGVNGAFTHTGLAPGDHFIAVSGLASNCTVGGDNPRTATVIAGDTTMVTFEVACPTPPCGVQLAAVVTTDVSRRALLASGRPKLMAGCARRSVVTVDL